jgi:uncharacterized membrane protein YdjX (TVP38/TMEM64 family)
MKTSHMVKLAILLVLIFGAYGIFQVVDVDALLEPNFIVNQLVAMGSLGPVVFIGFMVLAVVVSPIPSLPLDIAAGITFGPFWGMVYAVTGAEIGAIISFLIGRALGREVLGRLLKTNVSFCEQCSDHHLMGLVFVARLLPIFSFDIISYAAGLTRMSLKVFAIATLFGMIPSTFALTFLGGSVPTLQWPMILSGLLLAGLFLFLPKLILKNRSIWWVRLIQGEAPVVAEVVSAPNSSNQTIGKCSWCGVNDASEK